MVFHRTEPPGNRRFGADEPFPLHMIHQAASTLASCSSRRQSLPKNKSVNELDGVMNIEIGLTREVGGPWVTVYVGQ